MIYLTENERSILERFRKGSVQRGWDDPDVDFLACRGLLVRQERISEDEVLTRETDMAGRIITANLSYNRMRQRMRAQAHSYRISKRGLKALKHHRISTF